MPAWQVASVGPAPRTSPFSLDLHSTQRVYILLRVRTLFAVTVVPTPDAVATAVPLGPTIVQLAPLCLHRRCRTRSRRSWRKSCCVRNLFVQSTEKRWLLPLNTLNSIESCLAPSDNSDGTSLPTVKVSSTKLKKIQTILVIFWLIEN